MRRKSLSYVACVGLLVGCGLPAVLAQQADKKDDPPPVGKKRTADVVYVATPHDVVAKMLDVAKVVKDDVVYDLGCGDGRFIVTAAKKTGCRGKGYDLDPRGSRNRRPMPRRLRSTDVSRSFSRTSSRWTSRRQA